MSKTLNIIWQYLRAFVLIYACLYAGIFIASLLPVTIPGSIIGMLILFVLLALQILPAKWVNPGCYVLIRYMALLFVPIGVGVMQYFVPFLSIALATTPSWTVGRSSSPRSA